MATEVTTAANSVTTATPDRAWPVLSDLPNWPAWCPTVRSVVAVDPSREPGVGAAYRVRQPKLPAATWTITSWRPGEGFTWESAAPGVHSTGVHDLVRIADGTRIELELRWRGPLRRLLRLLYGRLTRRYVAAEAAALATHLESAPASR
jgi:uncharacterized membrane protein